MAQIDTKLRDRARELRREPTDAERALWSVLRDRQLDGHHFRRQHPIPPYVVDFACTAMRLVVEVDGGQHADNARDSKRAAFLVTQGWRVLRFWNNDVLANLEGVAERIKSALAEPSPRPSPVARGRESGPFLPPSPEAGEGRGGGSTMPRARQLAASGDAFDTVTLTHADRHRRHIRLTTDGGTAFLLDLAQARALRDGDRLVLDDGRLVLVRAAPEDLLEVRAADPVALARLAWHLGNRHTPVQVMPGCLRLAADHVLEHLLRDHLGAQVEPCRAPFDPESGAYHAHEH